MAKPKYERVTDDPEVQAAIRRVVDEAPPLTTAQIADLRILFNVGSGSVSRRRAA